MNATKRILNEFNMVKDDKELIEKILIKDNNIYEWDITFKGPTVSLYKDCIFDLKIIFNENYPIQAPIVKFTNKVRHINVNKHGNICLQVLKEWSYRYNIKYIILAIYTLLTIPNYEDPFDTELLDIYNRNVNEYETIVKNSFK